MANRSGSTSKGPTSGHEISTQTTPSLRADAPLLPVPQPVLKPFGYASPHSIRIWNTGTTILPPPAPGWVRVESLTNPGRFYYFDPVSRDSQVRYPITMEPTPGIPDTLSTEGGASSSHESPGLVLPGVTPIRKRQRT